MDRRRGGHDGGSAHPRRAWSIQATGGKTGPKVYATGTYANNMCAAMTSPTISVQAGSALSFASKYDIEADWDAGIVEVAAGPAFATWSRLTTINYPDDLLNTGNACGFPKSFSGTVFSRNYASPAYPASSYTGSLAAFAGKDIKLLVLEQLQSQTAECVEAKTESSPLRPPRPPR